MKAIVAILFLAAVASASNLDTFREWAKTHGKIYTAGQQARRFAIFKENLAAIERLNLEHPSARFAPNQFADLTNQEFKRLHTSGLKVPRSSSDFEVIADDVNAEADYSYMLPAIKNQASCGSCWAFSAVANAEGQYYKKHNKVQALSEQQVVSCDKADSACNGGWMTTADEYIVGAGLASMEEYPYTSGSGMVASCKSSFKVVAKYQGYKDFAAIADDADFIKYVDEYGPLSVAIEADTMYFQFYSGGILDKPKSCGTTLDHGVTVVGYGTESGKDFWLVRNSWGTTWGDKGFVKLLRGVNMCGINSAVSTILAKDD